MTEPTCPTCTRRPLPPGRTICTPCINLLRTHLDGMSDLMRALDASASRPATAARAPTRPYP
jgi:hypothetical protein